MNPPPKLFIHLDQDPPVFIPGREITGRASWGGVEGIRSASLCLFWRASGMKKDATEDIEIVEEIEFDNPASDDSRTFKIHLPDGPISFSGSLVELEWGLELVVTPVDAARIPIIMSRSDKPVQLPKIATPPKPRWYQRWTARNR